MKTGEIVKNRGRLSVLNSGKYISVDTRTKMDLTSGDTVQYATKRIIPRNGNPPFDVAVIIKLLYKIHKVEYDYFGTFFTVDNKIEHLAPVKSTDPNTQHKLPICVENIEWAKKQCVNFNNFKTDFEKALLRIKQIQENQQVYNSIIHKEKVYNEAKKLLETFTKPEEILPFVDTMGLTKWHFDNLLYGSGLFANRMFYIPAPESSSFKIETFRYLNELDDITIKKLIVTKKFFDTFDNVFVAETEYKHRVKISDEKIKTYAKWGFYLNENLKNNKSIVTCNYKRLDKILLGKCVWEYKTHKYFPHTSLNIKHPNGIYCKTKEDAEIESTCIINNVFTLELNEYAFTVGVNFPFSEDCDVSEIDFNFTKFSKIKTICLSSDLTTPKIIPTEICKQYGFSNFFALKKHVESVYTKVVDAYIEMLENPIAYENMYDREVETFDTTKNPLTVNNIRDLVFTTDKKLIQQLEFFQCKH